MSHKFAPYVILASAFLLISPAFLAAQQQESVADAARKAQAEKKTTGKPAKVFTNDNIDSIKGSISVVGESPAAVAADEAAADKANAAAPVTKAPVKDEAYWRATFADARKTLASDAKELDILQREYNLKEQQYYSDPNTALKEQYTRQDLTDTKTNIDQKTADVAKDKQAISDLEDALRKAGGEPGWASEPTAAITPPAF